MRRSCITSKFVCVVLETSKYFSGIGNDSSLGEWSLTLGSTWWRYMKFRDMDQKSFIAWRASGSESWGCGRDPSDSPRKSILLPPWIGCSRIKVGVLSSWSPPGSLIRPSAAGKINFPFSVGNITSFALSLFRVDFWCVHRFQLLNVCNQHVTLPNSPANKAYPRNNPGKTFFPNWWNLDWFFAEIGWYSTSEPNGMIGPSNGFPKRLSHGIFPSDKRSWMFR